MKPPACNKCIQFRTRNYLLGGWFHGSHIEAHGLRFLPEGKDAAAALKQGMSGATKAVIAGVVVGGAGAAAAVYLVSKKTNDQGTISP